MVLRVLRVFEWVTIRFGALFSHLAPYSRYLEGSLPGLARLPPGASGFPSPKIIRGTGIGVVVFLPIGVGIFFPRIRRLLDFPGAFGDENILISGL